MNTSEALAAGLARHGITLTFSQCFPVRTQHVAAARGSLAVPLTNAELERKLLDLAAWGRSGVDAAPLARALWSLDTHPDAGALMRLACPAPDRTGSSQGDGTP